MQWRERALSIRPKVIALLAAVFMVFALVEWCVGQMLLLPRFEEIERDDARTAMQRMEAGVSLALDGLQVSATDWGNWSQTYRYMQDHNREFSDENLNPSAMKQLHITALAFIDLRGRIVWSLAQQPVSGDPVSLDLFETGSLGLDSPWYDDLRNGTSRRSLVATNHGVLLTAVSPILDGYGHGPSRGLVLMGRTLTSAEIAQIGAKARTAVTVAAMRTAGQPPLAFLPPGAPRGAREYVLSDQGDTQVYRVFNDLFDQPIMTLRVDVPRTITAHARTTVDAAMAFTLGAAVAVLLLTLAVLDRTILRPLREVTRHATRIGTGDDLTTRLNLRRADEIGTLALEFDRMVEKVAQSRRQLIDNSFQAGMAEFSRGVMHNIGNAMTPLAVRIARLKELLRAAPVADVERAVEECDRGEADPGRQADLDAFLRLAGAELVAILKAADAEVDMLLRQSNLVQTALAERLPSSHARTVVEPIELPTIIHQSLEIVPDDRRELIDVELDRSLGVVGTVWTARTVLRLVIQNLIINAAEAVRAANCGRGTVRFTASLVTEGGQQRLQLDCQDSGCGIEPQNIERIFERGFSTKEGSRNSGIGLHWCATAINALGGRMWASSEGPGRGATLHVQIPVAPPAEAAVEAA